MTDRELLELAAKAVGHKIIGWDNSKLPLGPALVIVDEHNCGARWNPLEDDGDAFRLAVKLHICTLFPMAGDRFAQCGAGQVGGDSAACMEPHSPDPCAATRRAIVRAAAEIGRAMP